MKILKLSVNGVLFVVDRDLLVSKSEYFKALLDGPLGVNHNDTETLVLEEKDSDTFKSLLHTVKADDLDMRTSTSQEFRSTLQEMALFYMIEIPDLILRRYATDIPESSVKADVTKCLNSQLMKSKLHQTCVPYILRGHILMLDVVGSGICQNVYEIDNCIVISVPFSMIQMSKRFPGFEKLFYLIE